MHRSLFLFAACLCVLFLIASVLAQEAEKVPALQDAKTLFAVFEYMDHEIDQIDKDADPRQQAAQRADIYMAVSDRLLELAEEGNNSSGESYNAYSIRFYAFRAKIEAQIEGAEQKLEAFLDELAANEKTQFRAEELRFQMFTSEAVTTIDTPEGVEAFKAGLKTWIYRNIDSVDMYIRASRIGGAIQMVAMSREDSAEQFVTEVIEDLIKFIESAECVLSAKEKETAWTQFHQQLELRQFGQFYMKSLQTVNSPESFETFKAELKSWINRKTVNVHSIPQLALLVAEENGVPAEHVINELIEYLQSPECTSPYKANKATEWRKSLLTAFGSDLKLYGRTLDDKDFDWESLRGKYVLVQFTATWCGPCHKEIPGMREAYQKYHDKGFEIVSIYVWERGDDPVASIKEHVAHSKLPWIIISETLTQKAGQPGYRESFAITGVPMMLLVDKVGKIIMTQARGEALQTRLAEIFE